MDIKSLAVADIEKMIADSIIEDKYHGLPVITPDGVEVYAIARTKDEAVAALRCFIADNYGCLVPSFLSRVTGESEDTFRKIENQYFLDEAEEVLKPIIERTCGFDALLDAAVKEITTSHLACYDQTEVELSGGMRAYRLM